MLSICWLGTSCRATRDLSPGSVTSLNKQWDVLNLDHQHHTGLSIYDLQKEKTIFNYHDDQLFTTASNAKIFTAYTVLRYLDELVPAAFYRIKGDTIVVWGGGDPGTLYPDKQGSSAFLDFLKSTNKTIVFSNDHFKAERYGSGWAWDDYPFGFQCERTAFPMYGNRLWIDRTEDKITVTPSYFSKIVTVKKDTVERKGRNEWGDYYDYHFAPEIKEAHVSIPISFFEKDLKLIWSEATGKEIYMKDIPLTGNVSQIKGTERDSLLKWMMQESDNFIAEQLLLACSMKQTGEMDEKGIIEKVLEGPLKELPDDNKWVDGSGLSRYNLMSPRSLVLVLRQMIKQNGLEYVKSIFPAGGQSGTIISDYKSKDGLPYIYAKSGSLRGIYNLTGIMITSSQKVLLFSWMNNQIPGDIASLKLSMEQLFTFLRDHY